MNRKQQFYLECDLFLGKSSSEIKEIFFEVKEHTLALNAELFEQINKSMLTIKTKGRSRARGVIWLEPAVNYLKIYFTKGKYHSNLFEIFPNGWGGYPYIKVNPENYNIEQILKLNSVALERIQAIL